MNTDEQTVTELSLSVAIGAPSVANTLLPLPQPRERIEIAPATMADVDWIDGLQKRHRNQVGWHPRGTIEGKIGLGQIIVARATSPCSSDEQDTGRLPVPHTGRLPVPLGYCMASDRYMKREDVGIIYQLNIEAGHQRGYMGAALLKAQFERSAYGCRLYCCWCAQDIEANRFWEGLGFVPLAFRAGSEKRSRVHIFWQKRIRAEDTTTPWWFPSQTQGGSMSDRLVLPIPPGTHWSDAKPLVLPNAECRLPNEEQKKLPGGSNRKSRIENRKLTAKPGPLAGGLSFAPPPAPVVAKAEAKPREKKPRAKNDPKLVSAVRELRDRWLERVNEDPAALLGTGKYDVARQLAQAPQAQATLAQAPKPAPRVKLLHAA